MVLQALRFWFPDKVEEGLFEAAEEAVHDPARAWTDSPARNVFTVHVGDIKPLLLHPADVLGFLVPLFVVGIRRETELVLLLLLMGDLIVDHRVLVEMECATRKKERKDFF
jgi:hypothetical protein